MRTYGLKISSVELTPESLAGYDAVLVSTNHKAYDWAFIGKHATLVVDRRNAMKSVVTDRARIVVS